MMVPADHSFSLDQASCLPFCGARILFFFQLAMSEMTVDSNQFPFFEILFSVRLEKSKHAQPVLAPMDHGTAPYVP